MLRSHAVVLSLFSRLRSEHPWLERRRAADVSVQPGHGSDQRNRKGKEAQGKPAKPRSPAPRPFIPPLECPSRSSIIGYAFFSIASHGSPPLLTGNPTQTGQRTDLRTHSVARSHLTTLLKPCAPDAALPPMARCRATCPQLECALTPRTHGKTGRTDRKR